MRAQDFLKHLVLGALALTTGMLVGQSTTPGNVAFLNTDFLGWDNTFPANNFPLRVRHDLNQPIEFYTNAIQRMRLLETNTTQTIGSYTNQSVSGNLGVGLCNTTIVTLPWSLLHLDDGGNQFSGYRPWQRRA